MRAHTENFVTNGDALFQHMQVDIINRQSDIDLTDFIPQIPSLVSSVLELEGCTCSMLSIQFLSDSTMRRYHLKFFQDSSSTDCMSFPLMDNTELTITRKEYDHLGEILVCPKVAERFVRKQKLTKEWIYKEISLYIIHGLFHLLGYDDISDDDKKIMREKEALALNLLEKKNIITWPSL